MFRRALCDARFGDTFPLVVRYGGACREAGPDADGGGAGKGGRCPKHGARMIGTCSRAYDVHPLAEPGRKARKRGPTWGSPAGTVTAEDKRKTIERTTGLYAEIYGERARPTTAVLDGDA